MKDLKTYVVEAIKPPRLSAKNKELWANNKPLDEKKVWEWLKNNITIADKRKVEIVDGKINIEGKVFVHCDVEELPYPFGTVIGVFNCNHSKIKSLKNCPEYVDGCFICDDCPNLQSLKGAPKEVTEYFCCSYPFDQADVRKVCKVGWGIYC